MTLRIGWMLLFVAFSGGWCVSEESKSLYQVGETWTYDVKGSEVGIFGLEKLDETEIVKIAGVREMDGVKRWVVNIMSGDDLMKTYVDEKGNLHSIDFEGRSRALTVDVRPIYPDYLSFTLKVGEKQEINHDLIPKKGSLLQLEMKVKNTIERLANETVTTPAGVFTDCIRYRETGAFTIGTPPEQTTIPFTQDTWIHPSAHGPVQEIVNYDAAKMKNKTTPEPVQKNKVLRRYSPGRNRQ